MIDVEVAMTIRRPRRDVAAVMLNPRYETAWIRGIRRAQAMPAGPLRRGATITRERCFLGRHSSEIREVAEHVPGRAVETTGASPLGLRIRYELEGIPEGTIARISARADPPRWLRLVVPAINLILRRGVIRDLGRLKALLESGAWRDLPAAEPGLPRGGDISFPDPERI